MSPSHTHTKCIMHETPCKDIDVFNALLTEAPVIGVSTLISDIVSCIFGLEVAQMTIHIRNLCNHFT
jgi:hypothetical protein